MLVATRYMKMEIQRWNSTKKEPSEARCGFKAILVWGKKKLKQNN